MSLPEKAMRFLEEQIPDLAETAIKQAYWQALASGHTVLECENGVLVEVHPNGTKKVIKKLHPPIKVEPGQRLRRG